MIVYFEELASTNDEAMNGNYGHDTIIVARKQTAGRGQRGNKWVCNPNENLTFSLVLEPEHILVVEQYRISMMAALAASDALRDFGIECMIKWSNDLYVCDKKIGGILIEHCFMSETLSRSVIGIGINVLQCEFAAELPNPTSMVCEGVADVSVQGLLSKFMERFEQRYLQSVAVLHRDYMRRLWRGEGEWCFRDSNGEFMAAIDYINPLTGRLRLRTRMNELKDYWFKEVEFVL